MSLDPNKTYLVWNGSEFPNSSSAMFTAPVGSTIDWGDGTVESFDTEASEPGTTHTYTDGKDTHTIAISGLTGIDYHAFVSCLSLMSITIGDGVTSIGGAAFVSCRSLKSVTFGENSQLTSILDWAFAYCSSLTSIVIPDSVTGIGDDAFDSCSSLKSVVMGDSVTRIGNFAFAGCTSLQSIIVFATDPPTLGSDIPSNVQTIYVPQSSKSAYQAATNWNAVADKIVSDNLYLSFIRYTQGLKSYVAGEIEESETRIDGKKLDKPETPTEESAVVIGEDGSVGTKKLSDFGGGGTANMHLHKFTLSGESDNKGTLTESGYLLDLWVLLPTDEVITKSNLNNYIPVRQAMFPYKSKFNQDWSHVYNSFICFDGGNTGIYFLTGGMELNTNDGNAVFIKKRFWTDFTDIVEW